MVTVLHASVPQRSLKKNSSVPRSGLGAGRKKPTQSIPLPLYPSLQQIIKKQLRTARGEKNPQFSIIFKLYIRGRKKRGKKTKTKHWISKRVYPCPPNKNIKAVDTLAYRNPNLRDPHRWCLWCNQRYLHQKNLLQSVLKFSFGCSVFGTIPSGIQYI